MNRPQTSDLRSQTGKAAVVIDNVSKVFKLPHEKQSSLKSTLINFHKLGYEMQQALNDVSFEINQGEFFGIVGRNGSGKSTLLKIIAGIYTPTKGSVQVNGSLAPFIELGVGFNPELTGRENVFLNGALLGFSRSQMRAMYDEIVEFAELERFMDQKLKNYSSGMQVRLAFSIAIRARADILLLDEVLAVGDSAFQQKCYDYFSQLKKDKQTIVLVTHNMSAVEKYCDRAMLLENAKIKMIGSSAKVAAEYENMFMREEAARLAKSRRDKGAADQELVTVSNARVLQNGKPTKELKARTDFTVELTVKSRVDVAKANVGLNIKNREAIMLTSTDTLEHIGPLQLAKGKSQTIRFQLQNIFTDGLYTINIGVADESQEVPRLVSRNEHIGEFTVSGIGDHLKSLTHPDVKVEVL